MIPAENTIRIAAVEERMELIHMKKASRSRFQVIADMLAVSVNAIPPTKILYIANVTSASFKPFMKELISRGLLKRIELAGGKRFLYQTTQEGNDVLEQIRRLRDVLGEELW